MSAMASTSTIILPDLPAIEIVELVDAKGVALVRQLNDQVIPVRYDDEYYEDLLKSDHMTFLALCSGRSVCAGGISCRRQSIHNRPGAYILSLAVAPRFRGNGVATQLLRTLVEKAISNLNIHVLALHTQVNNATAIHLYQKQGFEILNTVVNYYVPDVLPRDAFAMTKDLVSLRRQRKKKNLERQNCRKAQASETNLPPTPALQFQKVSNTGDVDQIRKLNEEVIPIRYDDSFYSTLLTADHTSFVARDAHSSRTIGAVCYKPKLHRGVPQAYITNLAVLPQFRRQGIASKLLTMLQSELVGSSTVRTMSLHTQVDNMAALALYEAYGFRIVARIRNFYAKTVTPNEAFMLECALHEEPVRGTGDADVAQEQDTKGVEHYICVDDMWYRSKPDPQSKVEEQEGAACVFAFRGDIVTSSRCEGDWIKVASQRWLPKVIRWDGSNDVVLRRCNRFGVIQTTETLDTGEELGK